MKEILLVAYFFTCPTSYTGNGAPVVINTTHSSIESCEKTCKSLEENTLEDRMCKKTYSKGNDFVARYKCFCTEK